MVHLIRQVSQALFSAPYRLEILLAVLAFPDESFTTTSVHASLVERLGDRVKVPDKTTVNRTLSSLHEASLIESTARAGEYRRATTKFWTLLDEYNGELERRFAPRTLENVERTS